MSFHLSHLTALLLAVALGTVAAGFLLGSWPAAAIGLLLLAVFVAAFPTMRRLAAQVAGRPTKTGMEAMVGQRGTVARWTGTSGAVRLQGSLWNAVGPPAAVDDEVVVVGWTGSTVEVTAVAAATTRE